MIITHFHHRPVDVSAKPLPIGVLQFETLDVLEAWETAQ
jgi:hypothetical protein